MIYHFYYLNMTHITVNKVLVNETGTWYHGKSIFGWTLFYSMCTYMHLQCT